MVRKWPIDFKHRFSFFVSGKTTFIHYVANFFANKHSFIDRLSQKTIKPNQKEIVLHSHDSKQNFMFNRHSFPIDDQTILEFLDPLNYIINEDEDIIENLFTHLYGINCFTAVVYIIDGTDIDDNPDWNDLRNGLLQMSEELRKDRDLFKQLSLVFTNCPPHVLNFNCPTLNIPDNLSFYFMQNSAYQLFRSGSAANSVETDFCKAMETMKQIIKKIGNGIHRRA